jgi:hypothetical protein
LRGLAREEFGEVNPVVGRTRLFAKHRDLRIREAELVELL